MEQVDMGYDYNAALIRLNRSESEITSLRKKLKSYDNIPKTITNKQANNRL